MGKADATKAYRRACCLESQSAINEGRLPKSVDAATLHLSYFCAPSLALKLKDGRFRPLDRDNALAGFKAGIDGLRDAGVLVGDDYKRLSIGDVNIYRTAAEHGGRCCVEVRLEVME